VRHEGVGVDLTAHGKRVAPVDEDRRAVGQHDGEAGRTAEAGEPGQPLRAARHILALMFIGARHDEAVDTAALELGTKRRQARCRRRGGIESVIGLGELGPPCRERLGQFGIGLGIDQFDPFGTGQALGGGGDAAHQGIEGGGVWMAATPLEELEDVVWSRSHDWAGPYAWRLGEAN